MGDAFITGVNEAVDYLRRCHSPSGNDLKRLKVVKSLNKMSRMIRAKLNESEEMEITCESAGLRLKALKKIFYDVEDVLDEFLYHVLHLKSEGATFPVDDNLVKADVSILDQKRNLSPSNNPHGNLVFLDELAQKATDLKVKLDKQKFDWDGNLHGDGNIPVIAIVGMGGLGKTTLASSCTMTPKLQERFDKKIWVCVSEDFDVLRLTRAILESLEQEEFHPTEMDPVEMAEEHCEGKRLLLVFDDIWEHRNLNANAWEDLCRPLLRVSIGSKIIVTTRSKSFGSSTIPASIYRLPYLTNNDCFMLFIRHAFQGWTSDIDPHFWISRRKYQIDAEWTNILNNTGIWDSDDQNPIMPILRLSYQYLPTTLKKCFRYSPLINMWMAHGYLTQAGQRKGQLEDIGEEYINELVSMSFFEQSQNHETFQMHDLIHDLARDVSQGEWWSVEDGVFYGSHDDSVQHCSVISTKYYSQKDVQSSAQSRSLLFFKSSLKYPYTKELWSEVKQLRVLHMSYTGISIRPNCFSSLKHLRYLNLQGNRIFELPESLGSLYLLETLNLNRTNIGVLPDWICLLKHLRYLGLRGTYINYLPESLGMLDQLHTLDIESVCIDYLPDSISNLSSLRRLICKDDVVFPSEIRKLTDIQMMDHFDDDRHLTVKEITDLINVDEAKKVSSHSKEHLKVLSLVWNDNRSLMAHHMHGKVLESLGRHPNLRQLYMYGFGGNSLSSWLKDPSYLPCLNRIDLIRCEQLTSLPPLENFPRLRHVHIESAKRLQDMGVSNRNQWHGFHAVRVLKIIRCPELQLSRLGDLRNLQHLSIIGSNQDIPINFSSGDVKRVPSTLKKLEIDKCFDLTYFPVCLLESLEELKIIRCSGLDAFKDVKRVVPTTLQKLEIVECSNLSCFPLHFLQSLLELRIIRCSGDITFIDLEWLPSTLRMLEIDTFWGSTFCTPCKLGASKFMRNRYSMELYLPLYKLNDLEHLKLKYSPQLCFSYEENLPSTLQELCIIGCPKLEEWCKRHSRRLMDIQLLKIEDEQHQVDTSLSLSFNEFEDSDIDKDCSTDDDMD
ncbi:unnamed protein product [Spirodela intermedia]|uniref:Uncharacterized protein n=1 Tax=Spirodela intermedia TaxID=51605 RepID=A0A7I8IAS0_SPIIN|nr:unnamed protein product [Spirodela intermedia]CAA6653981.1 unnamed protein product [Spirodela intermedia]